MLGRNTETRSNLKNRHLQILCKIVNWIRHRVFSSVCFALKLHCSFITRKYSVDSSFCVQDCDRIHLFNLAVVRKAANPWSSTVL